MTKEKIFVIPKIVLETAHAPTQFIFCCVVTNVNIHYLKTHIRRQHADEETKQKIKSQTKTKIKQCLYENYLFKTQKPAQLRQHVESKQEGIIHFRCDYMNCTYGTDNILNLFSSS